MHSAFKMVGIFTAAETFCRKAAKQNVALVFKCLNASTHYITHTEGTASITKTTGIKKTVRHQYFFNYSDLVWYEKSEMTQIEVAESEN